ncbi:MAG: cytochrome c1 [Lysobacterales bacterium CG17_big_fil_post_rev_8_21_14_2_50_64_11]|nr:MAG: cytochrome c1 [Xanthomonadales bacterium CG17_big_fil_post_rev_8_21_14_2_50_64_11]PIX60778.1 MAG: cytochrome c1 [Xanthomonadales bacterium CG_4_10_14_3_um_filter_64_11]
MTKRFFAVLLSVLPLAALASSEGGLLPSHANINDQASLQRGATHFMDYCAGCHSLQYQRYSRLAKDLGLSEEQVNAFLNRNGAKFADTVVASMTPADATVWLGKAPPDLSLVARNKPGGADWTYNFLKSFYVDEGRPAGWNNLLLPNASMPHVLWELQGIQRPIYESGEGEAKVAHLQLVSPGTLSAEQYDAFARDLTAFLQYVGEPAALERESIGVWVLLFLVFLTLLTWLLKHEYWRDVH